MKHLCILIAVILLAGTGDCLAQYFTSPPIPADSLRIDSETLAIPNLPVPIEPEPFWTSAEFEVYSTGMIWRDCNHDGFIDLFIANGNDIVKAPNCIYISNGGVLPRTATWYSANSEYSGHCAVGDIDDNGWPDFLVANFVGETTRPWKEDLSELYVNYTGLPLPTSEWQTEDSMFSFSCALGDPDGDGDLDAAFATGSEYQLTYTPDRIYFNDGGILQKPPGWLSTPQTAAMDVTWGDVDNDGDLDLAFCYDLEGAAVYYNHDGVIETVPSWRSHERESANTLIFGDVDNDGWLDLIVAFNSQLSGNGYFVAYLNDGTGILSTTPGWRSATGGFGSGLALYDYDADGDRDLAAGRWFDRARIYENIGGSFTSTPVWRANPSTVVEEMAWVDVDGNGVQSYADTFYCDGSRKLFYVKHDPLHSVDSVLVDGLPAGNADFCYDLVSGWISLGQPPSEIVVIHYKYSAGCDLAISHWDTFNMIFTNLYWKVDMYAEPTSGCVPLEVHFSDSSTGATEWLWHFGDGGSSDLQNPVHTFYAGGPHDVSLSVQLPIARVERTIPDMVCVLADTMAAGQVQGEPGD
ncbi:MAG: VCBS repeat-containing protein, partial [Candidatus Zixiibacteriota bacterium]